MNRDEMVGKWKQVKGDARAKWGKLTDDDLDRIGGNRDKLVGRLQELYGRTKEDVEREVDEFMGSKSSDKEESSEREGKSQSSSQ